MTSTSPRRPELAPELPSWAEQLHITEHVRYQFHPLMKNAIGGPLIDGPKEIIGLDLRCPICKFIQPLGPPGVDHKCEKCGINYKYTAVKGGCNLYIWRDQPKLVLEDTK